MNETYEKIEYHIICGTCGRCFWTSRDFRSTCGDCLFDELKASRKLGETLDLHYRQLVGPSEKRRAQIERRTKEACVKAIGRITRRTALDNLVVVYDDAVEAIRDCKVETDDNAKRVDKID